jgi:uncharacterized membrane protein YjfL (UPF0719 family)
MEEIISSAIGVALAIIVAGLITFLSVWLFERSTRDIDEWAELLRGNPAVGIVLAAIVVAIGLIVRPGLQGPLISADVGNARPAYETLVNIVGLTIGLIAAIVAVGLSLWVFTRLTGGLNEWAEIANGNQAVAIMMAGVILAVALLVATSVDRVVVALTEALF